MNLFIPDRSSERFATEPFTVDLRGVTLRNWDWSNSDLRSANFKGADLAGVDFSCADLRGADFSDAVLVRAEFVNTDLRGAKLTQSSLRDATLTGAQLDGAEFSSVNLEHADLRGVDLSKVEGLAPISISHSILDEQTKFSPEFLKVISMYLDDSGLTGSLAKGAFADSAIEVLRKLVLL